MYNTRPSTLDSARLALRDMPHDIFGCDLRGKEGNKMFLNTDDHMVLDNPSWQRNQTNSQVLECQYFGLGRPCSMIEKLRVRAHLVNVYFYNSISILVYTLCPCTVPPF